MATENTKASRGVTFSPLNTETMIVEATFSTGKKLTMDFLQAPAEMQALLGLHGLKQKVGDAGAMSKNPDTGAAPSLEEKYEAMKGVWDRILAGEFYAAKGDGTASAGGYLLRALCQLYPKKAESDLKTYVKGLDGKQQAALRANPKVAEVIDALKAAEDKAAKDSGIDTDALLAGLED